MITGDHTLTACHVAHQLGITTKKYPSKSFVLSLVDDPGSKELCEWVGVDRKETHKFRLEEIETFKEKYDLCLSGGAMDKIHKNMGLSSIERLIPLIAVFARTSPSQKELVLTTLKKLGYTTLMCGDGTNDVGALKQAHVGVALISREGPDVPIKKVNVLESKAASSVASRARMRVPSSSSSLPRSRRRGG
eukprot:CAMPEP_0197537712 /NCGR_PEP_ID=MMETSP1318-20131121/57717_1 /TAXON_ID=552666 /ORGANISM="Partenskyella glossopodia, Strain RCC365" /LENGTH=190 /DNA_ID=CAMNT_0043095941 /DNA_START=104 /DNA_END=673 /DNA_ORIENTATION=-